MDILDRLTAHDAWTTRQLLLACSTLPDAQLDQDFDIDQRTLRRTFVHIIENMETWTDLMGERPVTDRTGETPEALLARLDLIARDFALRVRQLTAEGRLEAAFSDTLDQPPRAKTYATAICHLVTHGMHHRAQIMFMMEKVGLQDHLEGDVFSWESQALGWI
jgi:uncharacterized damage-inducible protein DinB